MKKDVLVSVRGTQFLEDDRDTIEVITAGSYYERNGKHYLLYDETIDGTAVPVHNRVKAAPGIVEVIKSGAVDCRMVFECGKKKHGQLCDPVWPDYSGDYDFCAERSDRRRHALPSYGVCT